MPKRSARLAASILCMCAGAAFGGVNQFTYTGPDGAFLWQIEFVDGQGTVLAMSGRRIYRSTDHGSHWAVVQSTKFGGYAAKLVVNPADHAQALAWLDKLYRSTDGGAHWTAVTTTLPSNPNGEITTAFTWSRDGSKVWAGTSVGSIYRSTDGGQMWTKQYSGFNSSTAIFSMDVDATDGNRAYARTGTGLFATTNGGGNWALTNPTPMSWIVASPTQTGALLGVLSSDGSLVRSANYGAAFTPQSAHPLRQLYYGPGGKLYGFDSTTSVVSSTNEGAAWSSAGFLLQSGVQDAAVDPADANRVLLATPAGVLGTSTGGSAWSVSSVGMSELILRNLATRFSQNGTLYAYTDLSPNNVFQRTAHPPNNNWGGADSGSTATLGSSDSFISFAVAPSDGALYIARTGNFGASTDDGQNWVRRGAANFAYRMEIDPTNPLAIYATDAGGTARSTVDGGVNWTPFGADLPAIIAGFAVNDKHPNRVYALAQELTSAADIPLYRSENGGGTWTPASRPSTTPPVLGRALAHEPGSENTVYIGLESGLFKTVDGGASWTQLDPYPEEISPDGIASISIDPAAPQTVYVTTNYNYPPMRSVDGGAHWEPLHSAAADDEGLVKNVVVDPSAASGVAGLVTYGGIVELTIAPDVALSANGALTAGASGSTTLTATNQGQYTATGLRLSATLPAASGAYTVTPTAGLDCAVTGAAMECHAPLLRPAATVAATIAFTPSAAGSWQAALVAGEADSAPANNSLTLDVQAASTGSTSSGSSSSGGSSSSSSSSSGGGSSSGGASSGGAASASSGGGGGGRIDYLLAALLAALASGRALARGNGREIP